jgi:hypothetical protein
MWDFLRSCDNADLVQRSDFRTEPTMDAENFTIYNGR